MLRAFLSVLLIAAAARADGFDKVRLKSGAVLQGTIVEDKAGRPLEITLLTGSMRTVPRGQIAKIELGHPPAAPKREISAVVSLRDGGSVRGVVSDWQPGKQITIRLSSGRLLTLADEDVARVELLPAEGRTAENRPDHEHAGGSGLDLKHPVKASAEPSQARQQGLDLPPPPLVIATVGAGTTPPARALPAVDRSGKPDRRPPELDTVYLSDGSILRGKLRDRTTLVLLNGRTRTLPPSGIRLVEPRGVAPVELDSVALKSGAVLRGTITADKPGNELVLRLVSGASRTVPYSQIGSVARKP